tara:strand:+ start:234 stop:620 length:387 start_codon:yes stop_codon:yes gene_type:complete
MKFQSAITHCFKNYGSIKGRAPRSEFWWFTLFLILASILMSLIDVAIFGLDRVMGEDFVFALNLSNIFMALTFIPAFTVTFRRLHDVNKSGKWLFIYLTIIGAFLILYWNIKKGDEGENRFGSNPLIS